MTDDPPLSERARRSLTQALDAYRSAFGDDASEHLRADLEELEADRASPSVSSTVARKAGSAASEVQLDLYAEKFPRMVGRSPAMRKVFELLLKVAPTDATVLIYGESGTGKELVALALHELSKRRDKPFIAENCAALPETLLESELFGHMRGAFTGADRNRKGRFASADGGTLFLDEVGDMSSGLQKKLLRALQEGEIRPVGSSKTVKVDVRFLSASNRDLTKLVEAGEFREDVYWRLSPIRIDLPPLRERKGDVLLLVEAIAATVSKQLGRSAPQRFSPAALEALEAYSWPGNVRELQNEIQRSMAMGVPDRAIDLADLSPDVRGD